jgi:radical SAM superfamily enzyme YgiQ (UPF0313 family)
MKIVLVFPPFYLESMYNLPPLGLVNLATTLKDTGHQVVILDFVLAVRRATLTMGRGIYDECTERILDEAPDMVGFSAQCTTYPAAIQISRRIKARNPGIHILLGGHNASFVDRATLERYPFIDAVVRGEGETSFKEWVAACEKGRHQSGVRGVTWREGEHVHRNADRELIRNLDELPLPDYSFLPSFSEYRDACDLPRSIAILEVGRGCPHHCVYCSESILWRRRTRTFSVPRLVDEMKNLYQNFNAECFLLAYDQFTARRRFVEAFCRKVINAGLNHLPWYCISRLDSVDADLLALMREAGCESMCYGIDSGSERTLTFIRKNIDQEILYERVVETAEQGIIPTLSYVIGFPEEERKDIDETLVMALRTGIVGNNNPLIQMPTVLPGTDLHEAYADRLVREVDTYFALGLEFDRGRRLPSDDEIIRSDPRIYSSFYNIPCRGVSLQELNLIATYFPLMVRFYPKTFLLLSMERGSSVSELFIEWLHWLKQHLGRAEPGLSPRDLYAHFRSFASQEVSAMGGPGRKHFGDILKYENRALEVGKFTGRSRAFHIDLEGVRKFKPLKNKEILMESFAFDVPVIIVDLKAGKFSEDYPARQTLLIFRQEGDILDVSEINPFARDLLERCDGQTDVEQISGDLYAAHGEGMTPEDFFEACAEAAQILGDKGFLERGRPQTISKGGEPVAED